MKSFHIIALGVVLVQVWFTHIAASQEQEACFYLDKSKVQNDLAPVIFLEDDRSKKKGSIRLNGNGLYQGNERLCRWSLNGGSGTKEQFSLDGDFAVPILDPTCETPFSHEYTGVGFGDWYLILCGTVSGKNLQVDRDGNQYFIPLKSFKQWTRFAPEKFPIEGDAGD